MVVDDRKGPRHPFGTQPVGRFVKDGAVSSAQPCCVPRRGTDGRSRWAPLGRLLCLPYVTTAIYDYAHLASLAHRCGACERICTLAARSPSAGFSPRRVRGVSRSTASRAPSSPSNPAVPGVPADEAQAVHPTTETGFANTPMVRLRSRRPPAPGTMALPECVNRSNRLRQPDVRPPPGLLRISDSNR